MDYNIPRSYKNANITLINIQETTKFTYLFCEGLVWAGSVGLCKNHLGFVVNAVGGQKLRRAHILRRLEVLYAP